ncbi:MAG: phosphatidate cytidylyltransferase [Flavobacteriales bacterium CG_4_10_14_0_2_um_filter_32_8]|nr:MAG: phosphatidate cytidylyltransferase [Flavobacteriales bacterium CG_4_10_14_0_2_um_filter_32_8]PJB14971.1 MAG: phosphatidate cytidylyltransferase [Flavobacteriales bacterium CG_4_9_14_3_um_filter_32_8]
MLTRTITGTLFILIIVAGIYFNSTLTLLLFTLIVLLAIDEFYGLVKKSKNLKPLRFLGTVTGACLMLILGLLIQQNIESKLVMIPVVLMFLVFIVELFRKNETPFVNIAYTLLGIFYSVIPFTMLFHLGFYNNAEFTNDYSYQLILGFFILLWTNDTGAYLSGRYFGKHKLFERISPKKTWEGSIGGGILTISIASVLSIYFTHLTLINWIIISILIAVFASLGDLVESMLKRSLGVKDSGKILPGHGGILDRFDGLLLSVPFVYSYLQLI